MPLVLLEAGCGVGNALFPLLESNPRLRAYAVDVSVTAVQMVRSHALASEGRIVAAAAGDLTSGELPLEIAGCEADLATLIFVLSAIAPAKMVCALRAVAKGLKRGGGGVLAAVEDEWVRREARAAQEADGLREELEAAKRVAAQAMRASEEQRGRLDMQASALAQDRARNMAKSGTLPHWAVDGTKPDHADFDGGVAAHVEESIWGKEEVSTRSS